jgi:hypothetical protein
MFGFIWKANEYQWQDTDDNYRCPCGAQVVMASPSELRSLEAQAQSKTRLCSTCAINRKPEQLR